MKKNLPITGREQAFPAGQELLSTTNKKGIITEVNDLFVEISGFSREELIGKNHNIIRHPDLPPAAFADLWSSLKAGQAWIGNRQKSL